MKLETIIYIYDYKFDIIIYKFYKNWNKCKIY